MNDITKRPRGRPRKLNTNLDNIVRTRGRPKGSKNKNSIHKYSDEMNTIEMKGGIGTMGSGSGGNSSKLSKISKNISQNNISQNHESSNTTHDNDDNDDNNILYKHNDHEVSDHDQVHSNSVSKQNSLSFNGINIDNNQAIELAIQARRLLAQQSLADYACMIDIPDTPIDEENEDSFSTIKLDSLAAHHELICNTLQDLVTKKHNQRTYDNVMFFMPPGSAKSTYTDVVFGSWFMAKFPRKSVILASYGDEPAQNQARKVKQLINSKSFLNLFPDIKPNQERRAVDNFALSNGSSFLSRGLFGEITSRRADLGIIDDPVKGAEESDSETMQKKTYQAYERNFTTRLKPGAPIVMIMTRWNEADLAGQILPEGWDGESGDFIGKDKRRWRVICLPAICDRTDDPLQRKIGESLWPEWFGLATGNPLDHWEPFRSDPRTWASLYQQKPTAGDGIYFLRENILRYDKKDLPSNLRYYGTSDYAVSDGKGDNTVLRIWGIDDTQEPAHVYLVDGWKGKTKSDKWIKEQCKLIEKYRPLKWFGEAGAIQKAIEPMLLEALRNNKPTRLVCFLEWLPSTVSKEIRARSAQALVQDQRVSLPNTVEYDSVRDEYVKFPAGKHDDDVDCLSLIGRVIDTITFKRNTTVVRPIPVTKTAFNRKKAS